MSNLAWKISVFRSLSKLPFWAILAPSTLSRKWTVQFGELKFGETSYISLYLSKLLLEMGVKKKVGTLTHTGERPFTCTVPGCGHTCVRWAPAHYNNIMKLWSPYDLCVTDPISRHVARPWGRVPTFFLPLSPVKVLTNID